MTLETNQKEEKGEYDPLEDPWYVHGPILSLVFLILTDRLLTAAFWHLEANFLVNGMGLWQWLFLTAVLVLLLLFAWYPAMGVKNWLCRALVYGLIVFHLLVIGSNLLVVSF